MDIESRDTRSNPGSVSSGGGEHEGEGHNERGAAGGGGHEHGPAEDAAAGGDDTLGEMLNLHKVKRAHCVRERYRCHKCFNLVSSDSSQPPACHGSQRLNMRLHGNQCTALPPSSSRSSSNLPSDALGMRSFFNIPPCFPPYCHPGPCPPQHATSQHDFVAQWVRTLSRQMSTAIGLAGNGNGSGKGGSSGEASALDRARTRERLDSDVSLGRALSGVASGAGLSRAVSGAGSGGLSRAVSWVGSGGSKGGARRRGPFRIDPIAEEDDEGGGGGSDGGGSGKRSVGGGSKRGAPLLLRRGSNDEGRPASRSSVGEAAGAAAAVLVWCTCPLRNCADAHPSVTPMPSTAYMGSLPFLHLDLHAGGPDKDQDGDDGASSVGDDDDGASSVGGPSASESGAGSEADMCVDARRARLLKRMAKVRGECTARSGRGESGVRCL